MAINFLNYAGLKPISMGDLTEPYRENRSFIENQKMEALKRAMLGNELEYQPERLKAEALQRELANRGLDIGNQSAELDLEYKPRNLQEEYLAKVLANNMQRENITGKGYENKMAEVDSQHHLQKVLNDLAYQQAQINQSKKAAELSEAKAAFERNRPTALSKSAEKSLDANNEKLMGAYNLLDRVSALDEVLNNPLIKSYIGNANQYFPTAMMRKSVKQIGGDFESLSGQIGLEAASDLKGSLSDKDLAFIQKQIPNRGDTYEVAKAKNETLKATLMQVIKRNELVSEYISAGIPAHQAMSVASKLTPITTAAASRAANSITSESDADIARMLREARSGK